MATPKKKKTGEGLFKKRFATLKEHRAAVAARKALKGGKNVGPVANADAYGSAIQPKAKPKAATPKKSTPTPTTSSGRTSSQSRVADHSRPNQTINGASLGSRLTPEEKKKREEAAASVGRRRTHRGGARASNNNRNRLRTPSGPKVGTTRRIRKGSKYVTQMWDGKKYVTGNLGSKGAKG